MMLELLLDGKLTGRPDGVIKDEVSMKKISSKKITSVIEDMLNAASTLCFDSIFMSVLVGGQRILLHRIPFYVQAFEPS